MQQFVDSYNNTYINLQALSAAGPSMDTSGPLVSDTTITRIQRTLRQFSSTSITGYEGGTYSMSLLGVKTNRDGTLAFNKNTFQNTLSVNSNVVTAFLQTQLLQIIPQFQ